MKISKRKYVNLPKGKRLSSKRLVSILNAMMLIQMFESHVSYYKGSFFWTNLGNAKQRRHNEEKAKYSSNISLPFLDIELSLKFGAYFSCKNVYPFKEIEFNGEEKTQAIVSRMKAEFDHFLAEHTGIEEVIQNNTIHDFILKFGEFGIDYLEYRNSCALEGLKNQLELEGIELDLHQYVLGQQSAAPNSKQSSEKHLIG